MNNTYHILISQGEKKLMPEMPVKPEFDGLNADVDQHLSNEYEYALQLAKEKAILIDDPKKEIEIMILGQALTDASDPTYKGKVKVNSGNITVYDGIYPITTDKVFVEVRQFKWDDWEWHDVSMPDTRDSGRRFIDTRVIARLVDRKPESVTLPDIDK